MLATVPRKFVLFLVVVTGSAGASGSPATEWEAQGWRDVAISTLDFRTPVHDPATLEFNPTIVAFRDSGWTEQSIRKEFGDASKILSQCAVRVGKATWVHATPPGGNVDVQMADQERLVERTPSREAKPLIFLFHETAFRETGFSYKTAGCRGVACGTVWLASEVLSGHYKLTHHADYNTAAHELVHVLGNVRHQERDRRLNDLMARDSRHRNSAISPEECSAIRSSPLLRKVHRSPR